VRRGIIGVPLQIYLQMENNKKYVVVSHPCYRSDNDLGLRIYEHDDDYLFDNPSMWKMEAAGFICRADAQDYIDSCVSQFYKDGYDE
jgi:hypothetical protein